MTTDQVFVCVTGSLSFETFRARSLKPSTVLVVVGGRLSCLLGDLAALLQMLQYMKEYITLVHLELPEVRSPVLYFIPRSSWTAKGKLLYYAALH